MGLDNNKLEDLKGFLKEKGILFKDRGLEGYMGDASFMVLGIPPIVIFLRTEEQALVVVDYAVKNRLKATIRAMGSGTAGATLAPDDTIILVVESLGVTNKWGQRLAIVPFKIVDKKGNEVEEPDRCDDSEYYVRTPAGASTEELDRALKPHGYHVAVVPSSGWSSVGGNFSTNAGGNGTTTYGTFKDIVNHLRMIVTDNNGAKIIEIDDVDEIKKIGGHQGLYGIITELDVRIVPIKTEEQLLSAVVAIEAADIETVGEQAGRLMLKVQENIPVIIGEFLLVDALLLSADDPLRKDAELGEFFDIDKDKMKMLILYQGIKDKIGDKLEKLVEDIKGAAYKEISLAGFKTMLGVRKAATGKSLQRVAIPGFEDIFVADLTKLGIVLKRIFEITSGTLPGRPIGHQYIDGAVIHYRPQAQVTEREFKKAWELNNKLGEEIFGNVDKYATYKRREHGLGLELYASSDEPKRKEILAMKKKYDPAGVFSPHLLSEKPKLKFIGDLLAGIK